jgi:hypothetical protein
VTGGDIEAHVLGVGWEVAEDAESVAWLHHTSGG